MLHAEVDEEARLVRQGQGGEHYRDFDANGQIQDPGDGFGILRYAEAVAAQALAAATAPGASENVRFHAAEAQVLAGNMREWANQVVAMIADAVECECAFADDVLEGGVVGMSLKEMRQYLEYVADQRLARLQLPPRYGARNPFPFMELQDVQELTNFFERRVSAYQVAVQGEVGFDHAF